MKLTLNCAAAMIALAGVVTAQQKQCIVRPKVSSTSSAVSGESSGTAPNGSWPGNGDEVNPPVSSATQSAPLEPNSTLSASLRSSTDESDPTLSKSIDPPSSTGGVFSSGQFTNQTMTIASSSIGQTSSSVLTPTSSIDTQTQTISTLSHSHTLGASSLTVTISSSALSSSQSESSLSSATTDPVSSTSQLTSTSSSAPPSSLEVHAPSPSSTSATSTLATSTSASSTSISSTAAATPSSDPPPVHTNLFFSPYKDITISANWNTNVISTKLSGELLGMTQEMSTVGLEAATWAFATGECGSETWSGFSPADVANANVNTWVSAGKQYVLSTGGANGVFTCGSDSGFSKFIDTYASSSLVGIDFDIEGGQTQDDVDNLVQRVKAAQQNPKYSNLRFSFTIATLGGTGPQNLNSIGEMVMQSIKSNGLTNYFVNLMTMDYGAATPGNCAVVDGLCDMAQSAIQAAQGLNKAYGVPFNQIEITPMIGGNDVQSEVFTIQDVPVVVDWAKQNNLGGIHFWSFDRDTDCPPGSASPTCNSYGQAGTLGFTKAFLSALS